MKLYVRSSNLDELKSSKQLSSRRKVFSAQKYKGFRIDRDSIFSCYRIQSPEGVKSSLTFKDIDHVKASIDRIISRRESINAANEVDENDLELAEQEFTSRDTSINSSKLPAIYKLVNFPSGAVVLDYGGGKFDNGVEYLESIGCEGYVYDPYNRPQDHNREVIKNIRANGGADIVLCSNVLNVIKEEAARINVLENIAKLVKSSGTVYITVYEGKGTGEAKQSQKDSYQLNRKTAGYMEEVQSVFPDATRKGKLIIASPASAVTSSTELDIYDDDEYDDFDQRWDDHFGEPSTEVFTAEEFEQWCKEVEDFDTDKLPKIPWAIRKKVKRIQDDLYSKSSKLMQTPEFGFSLEDIADYLVIDVRYDEDRNAIVAEVRSELSYSGMDELAHTLNPIVQKYNKDAYFDHVTGGIIEAYIFLDDSINSATDFVESARFDEGINYEDPIEGLYEEVVIDLDNLVRVEDDLVDFDTLEGLDDVYSLEHPTVRLSDADSLQENILDLIAPYLPDTPGQYKVTGFAHMKYNLDNVYEGTLRPEDEGGLPDTIYDTENVDVTFDEHGSYIEDMMVEAII